jgi:hypothetical protein
MVSKPLDNVKKLSSNKSVKCFSGLPEKLVYMIIIVEGDSTTIISAIRTVTLNRVGHVI